MYELRISSAEAAKGVSLEHWVALLPHVIWALVLLGVLLWIGRGNLLSLLRRVDKLSVGGVELNFLQELEAAARVRGGTISGDAMERAARRLARSAQVISGARILWVDDVPKNVEQERQLLADAGARVTCVESTDAAESELARKTFDLVISDMERNGNSRAGLEFSDALAVSPTAPRLIFYVGKAIRPAPLTAFGISDQPDELLHLVLDALSRTRG